MNVKRRTQEERSLATREALTGAARGLFAQRGFAAVGTEAIVRAAGVTRGALYHQFADKTELFAAVLEDVERDLMQRIVALMPTDPSESDSLLAGVDAWLTACEDPEVQRIVLLDAPAVLGWDRWREVGQRHGLGLVEASLQFEIDAGRIPPQPVTPLAHVIMGALDEAALYVVRAEDPGLAREQMSTVLRAIVTGLRSDGASAR